MNGYNFTEGVRKSLAMAREEAARLHHEYVGTEHMLLGMLKRDDGVAITVLTSLDVGTERLREVIETAVKEGKASRTTGPDLPYTNRAKKALELAMQEARELSHSYVGSEHLLLGLLREEKGIAAQVLRAAGLTLDGLRAETIRILGGPGAGEPGWDAAPSPTGRGAPTLIVVEVRYAGGWTQRREFRSAREAMAYLAGR